MEEEIKQVGHQAYIYPLNEHDFEVSTELLRHFMATPKIHSMNYTNTGVTQRYHLTCIRKY